MITFCPTRMAYLLITCNQAVVLIVPLCNVLVSLNMKKKQGDSFVSPNDANVHFSLVGSIFQKVSESIKH